MLAAPWDGAVLGVGGEALRALLRVLPEVHVVLGAGRQMDSRVTKMVFARGNLRAVFSSLVWLTCCLRDVSILYLCGSTTSEVWCLWGVGVLRTGLVTVISLCTAATLWEALT